MNKCQTLLLRWKRSTTAHHQELITQLSPIRNQSIIGKGTPFEFLEIGEEFSVLIAYSGMPGNTREAVEGVRVRWQKEPDRYNQIFSRIGEITQEAKRIIETGNPDHLGVLMNENHELLQEIGVSTPELDQLVLEAKNAGALGAKLSGGGLGGHIIALVKSKIEYISGELEKRAQFRPGSHKLQTRVLSDKISQSSPHWRYFPL